MKHVSWAFAGAMTGWAIIRLAGMDRVRRVEAPVAPLLSFTPFVAAATPACLLIACRKDPGDAKDARVSTVLATVLAALAGSALAAAVLPRAISRRQPGARGPVLRVITVNLMAGRAVPQAVVELVRRTGADVLFAQELTDDAAHRLKRAGLSALLPYAVTDTRRGGAQGSGIYARVPLCEGPQLKPISVAQPTARLRLPAGQSVDVVCVHPRPPRPIMSRRRVAQWRAELSVLPPPGDPPRVLAGDFNATVDHSNFRRLLRLGHVDAAGQTGNGHLPTWGPRGKLRLLTLDHVLLDPRCAVLRTSLHAVAGSDHRAVFAAFRLPG